MRLRLRNDKAVESQAAQASIRNHDDSAIRGNQGRRRRDEGLVELLAILVSGCERIARTNQRRPIVLDHRIDCSGRRKREQLHPLRVNHPQIGVLRAQPIEKDRGPSAASRLLRIEDRFGSETVLAFNAQPLGKSQRTAFVGDFEGFQSLALLDEKVDVVVIDMSDIGKERQTQVFMLNAAPRLPDGTKCRLIFSLSLNGILLLGIEVGESRLRLPMKRTGSITVISGNLSKPAAGRLSVTLVVGDHTLSEQRLKLKLTVLILLCQLQGLTSKVRRRFPMASSDGNDGEFIQRNCDLVFVSQALGRR
jgi:hypothetical protein